MKKPIIVKQAKNNYMIYITGNRDYRSPDIDINVYINENGYLVVNIPHTQRCYEAKEWEQHNGFSQIVFK